MKFAKQRVRVVLMVLIAIVMVVFAFIPVFAQCPLCKLAVENSTQGSAMRRGLNLGILVLLVPPATIFCSVFLIAIKRRKSPGE